MADEVADSTTAPAEVVENSSNPELEAARAELKRSLETNESQRKTHELHGRQYRQQIQDLQNQGQNYGTGYEQPHENATALETQQAQRNAQEAEAQREQIGRLTYRSNNPDWAEYEEEIQSIINDPVKVQGVVSSDRWGNADYAKSYQNAKMLVENRKLKAAQAATEVAKKDAETEQGRQKGLATISGTGASESEESVDVSTMTSDEMIDAGLVDMDPRDPARKRRSE